MRPNSLRSFRRPGVVDRRQQHVLDRDVLVLELLGFVFGAGQQAVEAGGDVDLVGAAGGSGNFGHAVDLG